MKIDRRRLLAGLGLGAATAGTGGVAQAHEGHAAVTFGHGVASGDPLQDRVILWTRVTPPTGHSGQIQGELRIGTTAALEGAGQIRTVKVAAAAERDWTVKVDVDGLKPGADYFYQFQFGEARSPVGRTRTLPDGKVEDVVLAVASCALFIQGYFNAYGAIAAMDRVDAVLHLGDYIYEYGSAAGQYGADSPTAASRKLDPPHEIVSLDDYRRRHACYKADPQLQAAHARAPWIVVWDDHETANDSWKDGAENHNPEAGEGDWAARKAVALKAYFEWMPIREPAGAMPEAINRSFRFGDMASLIMTETRLTARGKQLELETDLMGPDGQPDIPGFLKKLNDPSRTLMGPKQEAWFAGEVKRSVDEGEAWQVIGNQIVMARTFAPDLRKQMGEAAWGQLMTSLPPYVAKRVAMSSAMSATPIPLNMDQWDGYPAARERVYDAFKAAGARAIVLSGDSHSFWANELHDDAGKLVAAEFGTTGITSPGFSDLLPGLPVREALIARNSEIKFADSAAKGFVKLTLTRDKATADMVAVSTIQATEYTVGSVGTFSVKPAEGGGVTTLS
ncbi:MAG: alkaline phosphatase D family protein [Caulobacter sp.]|nr:alkaline phosphatase D family protein [Caulobacter sp.]